MPRNRTIYQAEALYVGPTPPTGRHFGTGTWGDVGQQGGTLGIANPNLLRQLYRVQSINYSANVTRTDINQFGELAAIDRIILEQPTVSLDASFIVQSFSNESYLGLAVTPTGSSSLVSAISGILNKTTDSKNYFIQTVVEGNDANEYNPVSQQSVLGVGNGFLASYSAEGSVGNFPTASFTVEGLNMDVVGLATGQVVPAIFPEDGTKVTGWFYSLPTGRQSPSGFLINAREESISALRPGDITLNLGTNDFGVSFSDLKIQNYTLSFDLNRQPLQKLGSKYAFSREIQFPVSVSLNVTADAGDLQTGSLVYALANNTTFNPEVTINNPTTNKAQCKYIVKGAKLETQQFSSSIGANKSVTLNFAAQLGGPQQQTVGLFLSGVYII